MAATNALPTTLANYYLLKAQAAAAAQQHANGAGVPTVSGSGTTAKPDTAVFSNAALQSLLASEMQNLSGAGSASTASSLADVLGNTPTATTAQTPQQALELAQQAQLQAEQAFLNGDTSASNDGSNQSSDNIAAMMTTYMQTLNAQIAQSIKTAEARVIQAGNAVSSTSGSK